MKNKTLAIIDGNSLIFRAFYGLPDMTRTNGDHTGAVYGFFTMLFGILEKCSPDYLTVAFDMKAKTFRHLLYEQYKAGRKKTPDELITQIDMLKKALNKLGITTLEQEGYEADDIIGTISRLADDEEMRVFIITGDKDALQLISENVTVLLTKKGISNVEEYNPEKLMENYGLLPAQIVELKALMGDVSDNIPGVSGVGEKTALKLLSQYVTLEELYQNVEGMPKNKLRERLIEGEASARLSLTLARIDKYIPMDISLESLKFDGLDNSTLFSIFNELEFFSLIKRLGIESPPPEKIILVCEGKSLEYFLGLCKSAGTISIIVELDTLVVCAGTQIARLPYYVMTSVLTDPNIKKTVHDAKALLHMCPNAEGIEFDTLLAAYVVNPSRRSYDPDKLMAEYSCTDLFSLRNYLETAMERYDTSSIFYDIEMPLVRVLFEMEHLGFKMNMDVLHELQLDYGNKIETLTKDIYELAGEKFSILSPKQLSVILFEKLGLPTLKRTKTGYSTDAEVLEQLLNKHPIIQLILDYRQLTKLKSTYINGLLSVAKNGIIHTTFNQVGTATGRLSSLEPNLQNIPVRSEFSNDIRRTFIPSNPENLIVAADYSQIELRVLAHIAQDNHMIDAFINNQDIHTRTASEVFAVSQEEVTREMRSSAKAVNFGIVYGISDFGLARNLGIPKFIAADYIAKYLDEFSGVRQYMKNIVNSAKMDGYVKTLFGRIRHIEELSSKKATIRSFGERIAMNTPIQGTAADIIKIAMIKVYNAIKEKNLSTKLKLQIHDELILETPPEELEVVCDLLRECMQNACSLSVPLNVDISWGHTWAETK